MTGMTNVEDQVAAALARAFGNSRLPDVVDLAVGQRVFDAIAARQGRPVWWVKWAGPVMGPAASLSPRVAEWSPRSRVDPTTINLWPSDDPDECAVIRGR